MIRIDQFLKFDTIDILKWINVCVGGVCSVHCRVFSNIPGPLASTY